MRTERIFWQPPAPHYDPVQAKKLLAEAGCVNGFDAGELGEPSVNYLNAVGIRTLLRLMESAVDYNDYGETKLRGGALFRHAGIRQRDDAGGDLRGGRRTARVTAASPISTGCSPSK